MTISKCEMSLKILYNSQYIDHNMLTTSYIYAVLSYQQINNYEYSFIYCKQLVK